MYVRLLQVSQITFT